MFGLLVLCLFFTFFHACEYPIVFVRAHPWQGCHRSGNGQGQGKVMEFILSQGKHFEEKSGKKGTRRTGLF